ncbi:MAG: molybdopterin molybdotransferase MoeA [Myxococcales bacterium]|nr:molybdopterin molybdotransferase MoeA [Myxococcales bacterium]
MERVAQMVSPEEALSRVLCATSALPPEGAKVEEAIGRALSFEVRATRTLPPWDNSAMDGYAVRSEDLTSAPRRLLVVETIYAGQLPRREVGPGQCARIMTGAPLPRGADAVVMQEKARPTGDEVEILEPASPRLNVRDRGEDAQEGKLLLEAGTPIGIPEAGLLWAQGLSEVMVPRKPKVAVFSSGDELCELEESPDGRIVDTNSRSLEAAVQRAGGLVTRLPIARDDPRELEARLREALSHDVVIASAGMSVGEKDLVRPALAALGVRMDFFRVAIKPGKPLAFGTRAAALVFGLPGNPTSSLVSFELFVRPCLRRLLGIREVAPQRVPGHAEAPYRKAAGLTHYVRVSARWEGGRLVARPLASQTSGALRSASQASHLMEVPSGATQVSPGDRVDLLPVSWVA